MSFTKPPFDSVNEIFEVFLTIDHLAVQDEDDRQVANDPGTESGEIVPGEMDEKRKTMLPVKESAMEVLTEILAKEANSVSAGKGSNSTRLTPPIDGRSNTPYRDPAGDWEIYRREQSLRQPSDNITSKSFTKGD